MILYLIAGCLIAVVTIWGFFGDADFSTLFSHWILRRRREKYKGKVIWITGSSSGIGEEIAYTFARLGCLLVICGTKRVELERVRNKCLILNTETDVMILCGDISDTKLHPVWLRQVIRKFGDVHVLVNNAGRSQRSDVLKTPEQVEREIFDINVFAVMSMTRIVFARWFEQGQKNRAILVTSSTAGKLGAPHSATYCATKHALHGYFEGLRSEMAVKDFPLQISLACPGPVRSNIRVTAYTDQVGERFNMPDEPDQKLMDTNRCAQLMVSALANGLDETWIAQQPILIVYYFAQYIPSLFRMYLLPFIMNSKSQEYRNGK